MSSLMLFVGAGAYVISLLLMVYLDLRLHALKQSGDLSRQAPQLIVLRWISFFAVVETLQTLYSRPYRLLETHTRRLVPIIRVLYPFGIGLIISSAISFAMAR